MDILRPEKFFYDSAHDMESAPSAEISYETIKMGKKIGCNVLVNTGRQRPPEQLAQGAAECEKTIIFCVLHIPHFVPWNYIMLEGERSRHPFFHPPVQEPS